MSISDLSYLKNFAIYSIFIKCLALFCSSSSIFLARALLSAVRSSTFLDNSLLSSSSDESGRLSFSLIWFVILSTIESARSCNVWFVTSMVTFFNSEPTALVIDAVAGERGCSIFCSAWIISFSFSRSFSLSFSIFSFSSFSGRSLFIW